MHAIYRDGRSQSIPGGLDISIWGIGGRERDSPSLFTIQYSLPNPINVREPTLIRKFRKRDRRGLDVLMYLEVIAAYFTPEAICRLIAHVMIRPLGIGEAVKPALGLMLLTSSPREFAFFAYLLCHAMRIPTLDLEL